MTRESALWDAIQCMNDGSGLYDVTIICTTDDFQAEFWEDRLSQGICSRRRQVVSQGDKEGEGSLFPLVLAVSEDWISSSGAGNGLGTLYAFQKACEAAKVRYGMDLSDLLLQQQISAALYHTAGKGTRLAPLPASENNNKPGVKLPMSHTLSDGTTSPITVLEAVVKQTGIYASSRKGRLSVFWGDQVFIPSSPFTYTPTHHVDILCSLLDQVPTAEEWLAQGLDKYGVIGVTSSSDAAQVEKVDRDTAVQMWDQLDDIARVGPSLGSFSLSAPFLIALLEEFRMELQQRQDKFDTDPHFWMPLTLPPDAYVRLMGQKGVSQDISVAHHGRMNQWITNFLASTDKKLGVFGAVDVGKDACWWDYGLLKLYSANNRKLLDTAEEAQLLRSFYGLSSSHRIIDSKVSETTHVDDISYLFSTNLRGDGSITNSILSHVDAVHVEVEEAIIVNCTAKRIRAKKGSILYNLVLEDDNVTLTAEEGDIIVGVTDEQGKQTWVRSNINICGGKAWKDIILTNSLSFEDIHESQKNANVRKIELVRKNLSRKVSDSFDM
jgi:hypothetical protein